MYKKRKYPNGMRFYPTFVLNDVVVIFLFLALFAAVVFFVPDIIITGDSQVPADPFDTPEHIKPEWYFLAAYQLLKLIPEVSALVVEILVVLALFLLPFIDRSPETNFKKRSLFLTMVALSVILFLGLTVWGALS